jgi:hypothetical protein
LRGGPCFGWTLPPERPLRPCPQCVDASDLVPADGILKRPHTDPKNVATLIDQATRCFDGVFGARVPHDTRHPAASVLNVPFHGNSISRTGFSMPSEYFYPGAPRDARWPWTRRPWANPHPADRGRTAKGSAPFETAPASAGRRVRVQAYGDRDRPRQSDRQ